MYDYYYDFDYSPYLDSYPSSANADAITSLGAAVSAMFAGFAFFFIAIFVVAIIVVIARWKLFKKAGRKPWDSLIPIHSDIVEFELGGIESYWYFLNYIVIIPFIGWFLGWIPILILNFWRCIALSKSFGKSTGFGVMMAFFPFVGYPMLAFGNNQYIGPQTNTNTQSYTNNNFNNQTNSTNYTNTQNYNMNNYNQAGPQQYNSQPNYTNPTQTAEQIQTPIQQSQPVSQPNEQPQVTTQPIEQPQTPAEQVNPIQPEINNNSSFSAPTESDNFNSQQ
ncbi:MAG: hypothetical protein IKG14_00055 [Clostridia bacterium]|nr:hypothetical protein [Clostridia bacterium]